MFIEKDKIPKSNSFVLKSSTLEEAMKNAGISVETTLQHLNSPVLFTAYIWPPRSNVPHNRFFIRAGCVPSAQAKDARILVETEIVPEFIAWATHILSLPSNSPTRSSDQVFSASDHRAHT